MWSDRRLLDLLGIDLPLIQAPMAGAMDAELVIAVSESGALGSLPCAMLSADRLREQTGIIRQRTDRPFNLNFFCHKPAKPDARREAAWKNRLTPYYKEWDIDPNAPFTAANRAPFDEAMCEVVEDVKPKVASFHFGLPAPALLKRVKAAGCIVMSSATTVKEAKWLEEHGADVIIAQGAEAGGHRGMFLSDDIAAQPGLFALLPQVVDAVGVPVVAAGGVADGRGIAAALVLGAAGAQIGTAYLFCPESTTGKPHRERLGEGTDDGTVITNLMTGRPARGFVNRVMKDLGPIGSAPAFPHAATALAPLRAAAEKAGVGDFTPLWSGQASALSRRSMPAAELTRKLAEDALNRLGGFRSQRAQVAARKRPLL
jgi:nitronate monooxygenase